MFINSTKTTFNAPKIAICSNDEDGFVAIQKIVQLFRWLNINTTFEFFEIAGKQYEKGLIYGISEPDLVRLKKTNLLIHTKFDESFSNENNLKQNEYLNIAMRNYFVESFYQNGSQKMCETSFFQQQKQYIQNIEDFEVYKNLVEENNCKNEEIITFSKSFGSSYAIFSLYDYNDVVILQMLEYILRFFNFYFNLQKYTDVKYAIAELKKHYKEEPKVVNKINYAPAIQYKIALQSFCTDIIENQVNLEGLFNVKQVVSAIKDKRVKIPDEMEIDKVIADGIEVYPNLAFWEDNVLNPSIFLRRELK